MTTAFEKEMEVTVAASNTIEESQIRVLIDDRVKAARAKDAVALVANHAPEVVTFDVVNPLQNIGADAIKQRAERWFASFQGPIEFEIQELCITRGEEVAFCHFLNGVRGTTTTGKKVDMWWRATMCCRKIDSKWTIVHEHDSVPFDMETGKASIDLKP
jgi:uncharacterized protein (TIGR02246 family)